MVCKCLVMRVKVNTKATTTNHKCVKGRSAAFFCVCLIIVVSWVSFIKRYERCANMLFGDKGCRGLNIKKDNQT
jgi:hypothetical protein